MKAEHLDPASYALPEDLRRRLLSPALVVWLDRVRSNLARVLELCGGEPDRWRPHVKTAKIPAVFRLYAEAGIRQFKCATTREAAELLECLRSLELGPVDLLCAYPLVGPGLERLAALARRHAWARVSVLVEDAAAAAQAPEPLGLAVDVNPGMHRTGVPADDRERLLAVARAGGERLRVLHYYDGHLHGHDFDERRALAAAGYDEALALFEELRAAGAPLDELVTSGTPTFAAALQHPELAALASRGARHRISPGTVVYGDLRTEEECPRLGLSPGALVFSRVVSQPLAGRLTCDAGSKALAAEAGDPCAVALGRPDWTALTPNEEHLPFAVPAGEAAGRGTELLLFPRHVCPTVNLAEEAVLIDDGALVGVVPVAARAHEVLFDPA